MGFSYLGGNFSPFWALAPEIIIRTANTTKKARVLMGSRPLALTSVLRPVENRTYRKSRYFKAYADKPRNSKIKFPFSLGFFDVSFCDCSFTVYLFFFEAMTERPNLVPGRPGQVPAPRSRVLPPPPQPNYPAVAPNEPPPTPKTRTDEKSESDKVPESERIDESDNSGEQSEYA